MNTRRCPLLLLLLAAELSAHGGQYRGASDVLPPSSSGSGSSSGSAASGSSGSASSSGTAVTPAGSATSISSTGAPTLAAQPTSSARPRGVQLEDDLTRWDFWWEFGKDPFLRLDRALADHHLGMEDVLLNPRLQRDRGLQMPTGADLDRVTQALMGLLQQAPTRDIASACMVALAKIARDQKQRTVHDCLVPYLRSADQEERETAALALGIAGQIENDASTDLLLALLTDGELGRKASDQQAVNERTRAFAGYALGLLLARCKTPVHGHRILAALQATLAQATSSQREVKVACIEAMGMFPAQLAGPAARALRAGAIASLAAFYDSNVGAGEQLLQAHIPTVIARIAQDADRSLWLQRFQLDLQRSLRKDPRSQKSSIYVAQSCALALGDLGDAWQDSEAASAACGKLLLEVFHEHHDQQTRAFALLSLARIGGAAARQALLAELASGDRAFEKPWVAVSLGVLAQRQLRASHGAQEDPQVQRSLRETFLASKNPVALAAMAVALGLTGDPQAGDLLRGALADQQHRDDVASYIAIGLGLARDDRAAPELRALLQASARRPTVMLQVARALGMLGDLSAVDQLCRVLQQDNPSLVRIAAVASALGQIGDGRTLDPLLKIAMDPAQLPLSRAFAVVALGGVCDKDPLPWNAAYATLVNYRACTSTLTDGSAGILDIL